MASGCLRHKGIKDQGLRCQIFPGCTIFIFTCAPAAGGSGAPENKGFLNGSETERRQLAKFYKKSKDRSTWEHLGCEKSSSCKHSLRNEIPELFTFQNLIGRAIATMLANVRALSEISTCLHLSHWPCTSLRRNSAEKRSQVIQSAARDPRCLGNGEWTTSQEGWGGELSKQHVAG